MRILYGTGNQGKLRYMRECLRDFDIELLGLFDMDIRNLPMIDEHGKDPLENAIIKAEAYYKIFKMPVFSCDSGLYFQQLPSKIQPGTKVRSVNGKYLSDDEMIIYYSELAKKYGDITAKYHNAICFIIDEKTRHISVSDSLSGESFIITSKPHRKRENGFPLDCLSVHIPTGKYYYDLDNHKSEDSVMREGFIEFFKGVL